MKVSRWDPPSYSAYEEWKTICPEMTYRRAEPDEFCGLLPSSLLEKASSVFAMGSASPRASVFLANLNRVDTAGSAIDQEPYLVVFDHRTCTASGLFVHHGDWAGRTTKPDRGFWEAVSASGILVHYPLVEMPVPESGSIRELRTDSSHSQAFRVALGSLFEDPEEELGG